MIFAATLFPGYFCIHTCQWTGQYKILNILHVQFVYAVYIFREEYMKEFAIHVHVPNV